MRSGLEMQSRRFFFHCVWFPGIRKNAILISMVRCDDNNDIGFLNRSRRLNVAIARATGLCIVVGDAKRCYDADATAAGLSVSHYRWSRLFS